MTALPPGPETDAKLHRLLGREVCSNVGCDGCDASMYLTESGWQYGERDGKHYSSDVSAAISAAEEARKAGKLRSWELFSGDAYVSLNVQGFAAAVIGLDYERRAAVGESAAHALSLALCRALEG